MAYVRKALVALVPFVGSLVGYFASGDVNFVYAAAVAALVAAGVYTVPNKEHV
jgi:hypothetical protein